jgi:hypothetical protein
MRLSLRHFLRIGLLGCRHLDEIACHVPRFRRADVIDQDGKSIAAAVGEQKRPAFAIPMQLSAAAHRHSIETVGLTTMKFSRRYLYPFGQNSQRPGTPGRRQRFGFQAEGLEEISPGQAQRRPG